MGKYFLGLLLAFMCFSLPAGAAGGAKHEVTVVYWGSADCRWCRLWETSDTGMEKSFVASPEFRKLKYFRVKNARLADDYEKEHFPTGTEWLWEQYEWKEFPHPWRPGWQVFVDHKLVDTYYGTTNWQEKALPRIQELVGQNRD
jgi:hypothetical protein